ncbi:MAG TPA: DUF374 domain-containing protein [Candidatus Kapabacteria bacterium]|jgi:hypothetical protein
MIERLLPFFATLLARTLRLTWSGDALPEHAVILFWHGKMFGGWYSVRHRKPVALVSASKDGSFLAAVLQHWGYKLSRGSTKKSGMEALRNAMERIKNGECNILVLTPDGPRGPRHVFKRGAFLAARELDLPLYLLHVEYHSRKILQSWDQFEIPMPFSRVNIEVQKIDIAAFPNDREEQEEWLKKVSFQYSNYR